jgi:hypothetical protein
VTARFAQRCGLIRGGWIVIDGAKLPRQPTSVVNGRGLVLQNYFENKKRASRESVGYRTELPVQAQPPSCASGGVPLQAIPSLCYPLR